MKRHAIAISVVALGTAFGAAQATAANMTLYCSAREEWCQLIARGFEDAAVSTSTQPAKVRRDVCQVKAEEANPKGDVWWGGTGDPHLQAAEEGLTEPYVTPVRDQLHLT